MATETSHYTVLARRFRPQTFEEVVGQEHVGQALRNAIRSGRVAHAYLFTGARGVGKTSTARIFAKTLNCPNVNEGVPCNDCDVCRGIGAGTDVDVLEIDGASNRGIDDIRQLRANVNVRSMRSPYKVYIIDEVHMLTKEAFNALLKTLEEPPPNVKFVFCTTEPNKVPDTILSRCQRFDFGTIASDSIRLRLQQIAQAEGREVDPEAVELVARRATGSMRDSQSLFDQLLAFGGEQISVDDVHRLLGTAPDQRLVDLVDALLEQRRQDALQELDAALMGGVQLSSLSDQLLNYLRDMMVVAVGADTVQLLAVGDRVRPALKRQAEQWGLETLTAAMQVLTEAKAKMVRVNYGRAIFELALVRMSLLPDMKDLAAIATQVASGAAAAPAPSAARPAPVAPAKKNAEPSPPADDSTETTHSPPKQQIALTPETLDQFWSQVLAELPDKHTEHLQNAQGLAISGPNVLDVTFPKSYLFSKSYCERSEAANRLKRVAEEVAGHPVTCRFLVDAKSVPAKAKAPKRTEEPVARPLNSLDEDPFVQNAVSIFNGQVVDIRPVLPVSVTDDEE